MPTHGDERDRRLSAMKDLLAGGAVRSQEDLAAKLGEQGFQVTQSSVSRDLRDLGAYKVAGQYRLPGDPEVDHGYEWASAIQAWSPAGHHMLVVRTRTGAAPQVGLGIDTARWTEVVGTVAGDDTLFIATAGLRQRQKLESRLRALESNGS